MSNPIAMHVDGPAGRRDGLGQYYQSLFLHGNAPPVYYSVNETLGPDLKQYSPVSTWIYRRQDETFQRLPGDWNTGDPGANARRWLTQTRNSEGHTLIDCYMLAGAPIVDPLNEPAPGTAADAIWLNAWTIEALNIVTTHGFRMALFSFPTGKPEYNLWQYLIPAMELGKLNQAVLSLHCYNDGGLAERDSYGNLTPAAVHNAFRHRQIYAQLPASAHLPIVYSEASADNGYGMRPTAAWIADLISYGQIIKNDQDVIAVCPFKVGGGESNCYKALPDLASAINASDWSADPVIPPAETETAAGTFAALANRIVDHAGNVWRLGTLAAPAGQAVLKNGAQFGGGWGTALLYWSGAVYVTNNDRPAKWYRATAAGWELCPGDPRLDQPIAVHDLTVPWVGQNTDRSDDDYSRSDCGPADVCMWLRLRGVTVSVDDVSRATGLAAGYTSTTFADLDRAANHYGLDLSHKLGTLTLDLLRAEIDAGRPAIVLVYYPALPARFDPAYRSSHWILIKGYQTGGFIYHDPYWPDAARGANLVISDQQLATALAQVTTNGNTANQGMVETLAAPAEHIVRGLHMRADGHSTQLDFDALRVARLTGAKIMTNTSFDELHALLKTLAPAHLVLRLFYAGDNLALRDARAAFDQARAWLTEFARVGGSLVELHNEPNLRVEGMYTMWPTVTAWQGWYNELARQIRSSFPTVAIGWPGLSPKDSTSDQWVRDADFTPALQSSIAAGLVDWIGSHCYWTTAAQMLDPAYGCYYRRLLGLGRRVIITEFSNNSGAVSDTDKGQQYKQYYAALPAGVSGAYCFVSSASKPAFNSSGETWVRNGALTVIPTIVGS